MLKQVLIKLFFSSRHLTVTWTICYSIYVGHVILNNFFVSCVFPFRCSSSLFVKNCTLADGSLFFIVF